MVNVRRVHKCVCMRNSVYDMYKRCHAKFVFMRLRIHTLITTEFYFECKEAYHILWTKVFFYSSRAFLFGFFFYFIYIFSEHEFRYVLQTILQSL